MSISSPPRHAPPAYRPAAAPHVPTEAQKGLTGRNTGTPVGVFRARPVSTGEILVLITWLFIAVILPMSYGLWLGYTTYTDYGPAALPSRSYPWLLAAGCGFMLWSLILYLRLRDSRRMVLIQRGGLLLVAARFQNPHPRTIRSVSWDQISGIAIEVTAATSSHQKSEGIKPVVNRAWINLHKGKPLRFSRGKRLFQGILRWQSLPGLAELITQTKARYYRHILPKLRTSLSNGELLNFGPISIHRQYFQLRPGGLFRGPGSIPWNKVQHITIRSGVLVIELIEQNQSVSKKRIPIKHIPNLELLMRLIDQYAH